MANTITAERVRRVIKGVKTAKNENLKNGLGVLFSYFELGPAIEMESILQGKNLPSYEEFTCLSLKENNGWFLLRHVDDETCRDNRIDFCQLPYEIYSIVSTMIYMI